MTTRFQQRRWAYPSRSFCCVTALLLSLALSDQGFASCGDYLHVGGRRIAGHAMTGRFEFSRPDLPFVLPTRPDQGGPRECRGPSCRRHLPMPQIPTSVPTTISAQDYIAQLDFADSDMAECIRTLEQCDLRPSNGYPLGIRRPPRV